MRDTAGGTKTTARQGRVLLVEDDDLVREALEILLSERLDVAAFDSAEAALEGFVAGCYDVLLTDLRLPGRHGHELRRALQQVDPGLSALLMTADELERDDPRLLGFDDCWRKPLFDLDTVLDTVVAAAQASRRRRAG